MVRRLLIGVLAVAVVGCGAAPEPGGAPTPFPDVVLGEVSEFGTEATVTELNRPRDLLVVGATPDPVVFSRKDPNNGCRLALAAETPPDLPRVDAGAVFVDHCHGNQYDAAGRPLADSAPRPMHTVPTEVRDGVLIWTRTEAGQAVDASLTPE